MAKKQSSGQRPSWQSDFVSCTLTQEQRGEARKWDVKYEQTFDVFDRLIDDNIKISFSVDKRHDCVGVYATKPAGDGRERAICLSARGPNFLEAMKVLAYKHAVVLDGMWDTVPESEGEDLRWG